MSRFPIILLSVLLAAGAHGADTNAPAKRTAVATIFPLYDWARVIGGDRMSAEQLLPAGVEAHSYAPRPRDVARLASADFFLWCGPAMEPWAVDLLRGLHGARGVAFEAGRWVGPLGEPAAQGETDGHGDVHAHAGVDPHFWLDPLAAKQVVEAMGAQFAERDAAGAGGYRARAAAYARELDDLHGAITSAVARARTRTLVYAGHLAFDRFGRRYGVTFLSPYAGFAPDAEPGPRALAALIGRMRTAGTTIVYHEELIDPRVARAIARETGARLRLLHGVHNVTDAERRAGVTYLSLMRANLEALKDGLGVEEAP